MIYLIKISPNIISLDGSSKIKFTFFSKYVTRAIKKKNQKKIDKQKSFVQLKLAGFC